MLLSKQRLCSTILSGVVFCNAQATSFEILQDGLNPKTIQQLRECHAEKLYKAKPDRFTMMVVNLERLNLIKAKIKEFETKEFHSLNEQLEELQSIEKMAVSFKRQHKEEAPLSIKVRKQAHKDLMASLESWDIQKALKAIGDYLVTSETEDEALEWTSDHVKLKEVIKDIRSRLEFLEITKQIQS